MHSVHGVMIPVSEHLHVLKRTPREYNTRIRASCKLYVLRGISSAHAGIKGGWPGTTICQYGGRMKKKEEKPERYPGHYMDSFTAKNTCTDNYGALYCKIYTLRPDFAAVAAIAVVRSGGFGNWQEAPWAVPT